MANPLCEKTVLVDQDFSHARAYVEMVRDSKEEVQESMG